MPQFSYQPSEAEVGNEPLGFNGQGDWTAAGSAYQVVTTPDGRRAINWTTSSGQTVAMIWSGNGNPPASSNYEMFVRFRLRVAGGKLHEFGPAVRANAVGSGSYNAYFQRHRALGGGTINMRMQEYNSATLAGETDAINSPLNSAIDVDLSSVVRCVDGTITFKTWLSDGTEVGNTTLTDATITQASLPYLVMGQAGDVLIYFIGVGTFNSTTGQIDPAPRGGAPVVAGPVITGPSGAAGAASITTSSAENQNILGVWTATGTGTWSVIGTDAPDLTISGGTVTRTAGNLDFEAKPVWNFTVVFGTASQEVTHNVTNINEPPQFIGPAIGALVFTVGVPITPVPLATRWVDPEGLAITASIVQALPPGLSVVSGQLQGTPTATQSATTYTPRGADPAGNGTNGTAFTIAIQATGTAPSITTQPQSQAVLAGASVTLSVVASGSGTLAYQWRRNGVNIAGATAASYTFTATLGDNGAVYSVVVTGDTAPPATSANATLTVNAPVTYSATVGPFGANTGEGQRAAGTAFEAVVFPAGYVLGDASPPTPLRITGTLNAGGLAVLTGLPAAGSGEAWFMFPGDPEPAKADRGTARSRYTAA